MSTNRNHPRHAVAPSNVTVFGATGQTGRLLVPMLLDAGHHVTAFIHSHPRNLDAHDRLRVVAGDVLDAHSIPPALDGCNAVVVLLGRPLRRAGTLRTVGTSNIVSAMTAAGVDRLVCLATFGYDDGAAIAARGSWWFRRVVKPVLLGDTLRDHAGHERAVRDSDLVWTIIRTAQLVDGDAVVDLHTDVESSSAAPSPVPRAALAQLIVATISADAHRNEIVSVSTSQHPSPTPRRQQ